MSSPSFQVILSFQGKSTPLDNITTGTTAQDLIERVCSELGLKQHDHQIKIFYKGKNLVNQQPIDGVVFNTVPRKSPKLLVVASSQAVVQDIQNRKSDPLIRGLDQERIATTVPVDPYWGTSGSDRHYKFVRIEPCTSFQNAHDKVPHMMEARRLLEKLSTDPGMVAVLRERQLVVNTLGEMDPLDDRIMQKTQAQGGCLLGYNTNRGLRIDLRLRSQDLQSFLPYPQIAATLLHEISHNWFGEHDLFFWTNYGQMRAEYLHEHVSRRSSILWRGQTSAQIANLPSPATGIYDLILHELQSEMAQHGLHPRMIAPAILERCQELQSQVRGNPLSTTKNNKAPSTNPTATARELALAAAERRVQEHQNQQQQRHQRQSTKDEHNHKEHKKPSS